MFSVNEYKIVFKRVWHDAHPSDGRYDTKCEIYVQDKSMVGSGFKKVYRKEPSFTGIAKLHPNDRPDKTLGKKIALRNAIGYFVIVEGSWEYNCADFYKKEVRTAIWKAFWKWVKSWAEQIEEDF